MLEELRKKPFGQLYQLKYLLLISVVFAFFYFSCDKPLSLFIYHLKSTSSSFGFLNAFAQSVQMIVKTKHLLIFLVTTLVVMHFARYRGYIYQLTMCFFLLLLIDNSIIGLIKHFLGRMRPQLLIHQGLFGFKFFAMRDAFLSFPSGHSVNIMLLTLFLMMLYPKKNYIVLTIGLCICFSRVWHLKHYLSDVFASVVIVLYLFPLEWYVLEKISQYPSMSFIRPLLEVFNLKTIRKAQ